LVTELTEEPCLHAAFEAHGLGLAELDERAGVATAGVVFGLPRLYSTGTTSPVLWNSTMSHCPEIPSSSDRTDMLRVIRTSALLSSSPSSTKI
jgi:hypothetical protein